MSWYGTHANVTKETVKSLIPKAACKRTVYFLRVMLSRECVDSDSTCDRCGITYNLFKLKQQLKRS